VCEKSYPSRARKEAVRHHPWKTAPSRSRLGFLSRFSHTLKGFGTKVNDGTVGGDPGSRGTGGPHSLSG